MHRLSTLDIRGVSSPSSLNPAHPLISLTPGMRGIMHTVHCTDSTPNSRLLTSGDPIHPSTQLTWKYVALFMHFHPGIRGMMQYIDPLIKMIRNYVKIIMVFCTAFPSGRPAVSMTIITIINLVFLKIIMVSIRGSAACPYPGSPRLPPFAAIRPRRVADHSHNVPYILNYFFPTFFSFCRF